MHPLLVHIAYLLERLGYQRTAKILSAFAKCTCKLYEMENLSFFQICVSSQTTQNRPSLSSDSFYVFSAHDHPISAFENSREIVQVIVHTSTVWFSTAKLFKETRFNTFFNGG